MPEYRLPYCIAVSLLEVVRKNIKKECDAILSGSKTYIDTELIEKSIKAAIQCIEILDGKYKAGIRGFCEEARKAALAKMNNLINELHRMLRDDLENLLNREHYSELSKKLSDLAHVTTGWSVDVCNPDEVFYCPADPANKEVSDKKKNDLRRALHENNESAVLLPDIVRCHCDSKNGTCSDVFKRAAKLGRSIGPDMARKKFPVLQFIT